MNNVVSLVVRSANILGKAHYAVRLTLQGDGKTATISGDGDTRDALRAVAERVSGEYTYNVYHNSHVLNTLDPVQAHSLVVYALGNKPVTVLEYNNSTDTGLNMAMLRS